jgi:prepilin-type N-terminal cleavage/methylation domain-containing protein
MTPRRGFTLLEVSLVLAVIVLLAAMAWPSIEAMYDGVRLSAAADQIRARWADARTQAIEEGRPYRFGIIMDEGRFRIAPDTAQHWGGGGTAPELSESDTPELVLEESLPNGVRFAEGTGAEWTSEGGAWLTVVRFLPDGTASQDVEIKFESSGSRPLYLRLRGLTGAVTVRAQPAEVQP